MIQITSEEEDAMTGMGRGDSWLRAYEGQGGPRRLG